MEESFPREERICDEQHAGFSNDMISELPDSLISQILSYLRTKDVVGTSALSKRWESVWLLISGLDLESDEFPDYDAFVSFMNKVLDLSREHKLFLQKLKLSIDMDENEQPCLTRWMDVVATLKLKHLDVECLFVTSECLEMMPLSLFVCETLLYLRLHQVLLGKVESVSLPCLKAMSLELNVYADEASLELLISSFPVLEDLIVARRANDNVQNLRVHSQTITSLRIKVEEYQDVGESLVLEEFDNVNSGLLIDAPRLEYLELISEVSESKIISNSGSLAKIYIDGCFLLNHSGDYIDLRKQYMVHNFFISISEVSEMKISYYDFKFIQENIQLPQFCNLSSLEIELRHRSLESLPTFLENFPNLKSLILVLVFCSIEQIRHSSVPHCFLPSLEFVKINSINSQGSTEMEVARYFTENSVILKKLVMRLGGNMQRRNNIVEDLLALPRRSSKCHFVVYLLTVKMMLRLVKDQTWLDLDFHFVDFFYHVIL